MSVADWLLEEPDSPEEFWDRLVWDAHWWHLETGVNSYRFIHGYEANPFVQVTCRVETVFSLARSKLTQEGAIDYELADWVCRLHRKGQDFADIIVEMVGQTDVRICEPVQQEEVPDMATVSVSEQAVDPSEFMGAVAL